MRIGIDFDGTIIKPIHFPSTEYVLMPDVKEVLNELAKEHTLILSTARYGWYFDSAVEFIEANELPITICKTKPIADIYIDDKNLGCKAIVWKDILKEINKIKGGIKMNRVFEIEEEQLKQYLDMHKTYSEIAEVYGCSSWTVMKRAKELGLKSEARKYQMQVDNPAAKEEVAKKISAKIAKMWEDGLYENRVNGMLGMTGELYPKYTPEGTKCAYRDKARFYHPEAICLCCGKQLSWDDKSIEVHHVNENHEDFSLTNLKPLCHSCHKKYHRKSQPIVTITKSFVFDCCHYLPYHDRKCKFLHGHTYHMEISVTDRVLQETGMVIDFGNLKQIVNEAVIDKFDHGFLNQYIEYPTCELMINWIWQQLSIKLKGLTRIRLWETDGSYCEMTSGQMLYYLQNFECDWTKDSEVGDES